MNVLLSILFISAAGLIGYALARVVERGKWANAMRRAKGECGNWQFWCHYWRIRATAAETELERARFGGRFGAECNRG